MFLFSCNFRACWLPKAHPNRSSHFWFHHHHILRATVIYSVIQWPLAPSVGAPRWLYLWLVRKIHILISVDLPGKNLTSRQSGEKNQHELKSNTRPLWTICGDRLKWMFSGCWVRCVFENASFGCSGNKKSFLHLAHDKNPVSSHFFFKVYLISSTRLNLGFNQNQKNWLPSRPITSSS